MVSSFVKSTTMAVAMLVATSEAHQKMTVPLPTWPDGFYNQNSPSSIIDPTKVLPCPKGMTYNADGASNTKAFWTAYNASSYKSLKTFAWKNQKLNDGASNECGFSIVDGTPQDLPDMVQWDGFSHPGPLEVYCDDTLVAQSLNAAAEFPETPANIPYDKTKCVGASLLTVYWYAFHVTPWQVYTNCAALTGASPSKSKKSSSNEKSDTAATEMPATTAEQETDAAATEMPATTADQETDTAATEMPAVAATTAEQETETEDPTQDGEEEEMDEPVTTDETSVSSADETQALVKPPTDKCSVRRLRR